jgi:hypothetical protein
MERRQFSIVGSMVRWSMVSISNLDSTVFRSPPTGTPPILTPYLRTIASSTILPRPPRVTLVHLKIENPIIENHSDPFIDLSHLADKLGRREAKRIALKFANDIQDTGNWYDNYAREYGSVAQLLKEKPNELRNLYFNVYKFLDDTAEIELLKEAGYDGAIHIGNGETATVLEYRVFNPHQVRSALSGRSIFRRSGRKNPR